MMFVPIPDVFANGAHGFGCKLGDTSYLVVFDPLYPQRGWTASWQKEGYCAVHLTGRYATRKRAEAAISKIAQRHAN